ncbi:type II toxin-antitoxin system RelE/ParE family toxin [Candidatus Pacearchaeota archaeon]|nr:type II toxin-antitoxin system RelE/ParE family toxin [Candidatus Pacearchaeota archaeon]
MYNLIFEKRALGDLNKLEIGIKQRIWDKLQQCKENPFRFLDHLENINGFKLRVGEYRLIVDVDTTSKIIKIIKLGHRKNIYEN